MYVCEVYIYIYNILYMYLYIIMYVCVCVICISFVLKKTFPLATVHTTC